MQASKTFSILILISVLGSTSVSASELWEWKRSISSIKTFGGGNSSTACFTSSGLNKHFCFQLDDVGGDEKFSLLMMAKASNSKVSFSYRPEDGKHFSGLWFKNQLLLHLFLE